MSVEAPKPDEQPQYHLSQNQSRNPILRNQNHEPQREDEPSDEYGISVWDPRTGKELQRLLGHSGSVFALALTPDDTLVSRSADTTVRIWDYKKGKEINRLDPGTSSNLLAVTPYSEVILPEGIYISVWYLKIEVLRRLEGHTGHIRAISTNRNNGLVSIGDSTDHTIRIWNLEAGQEFKRIDCPYEVTAIATFPDGRIASGGYGINSIWDSISGEELNRWENIDRQRQDALAITAHGKVLASTGRSIRMFQPETGTEVKSYESETKDKQLLEILADGRIIFGTKRNTISIVDMETENELETARIDTPLFTTEKGLREPKVFSTILTPDGKIITGKGVIKKRRSSAF